MKRFAVAMVLALVLVVGVAAVAMAAGPGPAANVVGVPGTGQQVGYGSGTFVDLDGDGQCDDYATRVPAQDGTGSQWGQQQGGMYRQAPASGTGIGTQPQDGTGMQIRQGGRWGR